MAFCHTGQLSATDRSALPPKMKGADHACPSLRTGKEQGSSVPGLPATAIGVSAGPFPDRNLAAEKEKPRSKAGGFPYGAKDGT